MDTTVKSSHIQIRVSSAVKRRIQKAAFAAHMDMSEWILRSLFPQLVDRFVVLVEALARAKTRKVAYANLNDFLASISPAEFKQATRQMPSLLGLPPLDQNYLAAMLELAAARKNTVVPVWVGKIAPLAEPYYGTSLQNLRLHLLVNSPPPFKRRNIFIDASIGDRI